MSESSARRLLARQVERSFPEGTEFPEGWESFLAAVEATYQASDEDRRMLERSMELSSAELLEANAELREATVLAKDAARAKGEFLATMSHEIRTPLNGVLGMSGLLLECELEGRPLEFARTIQQSAECLLALVNDILDFSKIESGGIEYENVPCDPRKLVGETAQVVATLAEQKRIEVCHLVMPDVPPCVVVDPTRVRQVLLNLLSNAIKFTHEGEVSLLVSAEGSLLTFEVRDTGIGIPQERQEAIFESFAQVDSSTTRRYGGTGLGLAIVKRLATGMGGEVAVESVENEGSTFRVRIPFQLGEADVEGPPTGLLDGLRVLVVDDNETNRRFLRYRVESWGGEIDEACTGTEAVELLRRDPERWDLVYLDYQMPGMDGEETYVQLRTIAGCEHLPVVLLTSVGDVELGRRLCGKGLSGFLAKPVMTSTLACTTYRALNPTQASASDRRAVARAQGAPGDDRARTLFSDRTVLVAEDDPATRTVMLAALESLGIRGVVAHDGREAVDRFETAPFDLVLMDLMMPEMDGLEATAEIRSMEDPTAPRTPIVVLSASARRSDEESSLRAGANAYLRKPIALKDLVRVVTEWLEIEAPARIAPAPCAESESRARPRQDAPTVLVVDDNATNRRLMEVLLEEKGYRVLSAPDGVRGVEVALAERVDLVFLDLHMPRMDGHEAATELRRHEREGTIGSLHVVGLTAGTLSSSDESDFRDAGADEVLFKPFRTEDLFELLARRLAPPPPLPAPADELEDVRRRFLG